MKKFFALYSIFLLFLGNAVFATEPKDEKNSSFHSFIQNNYNQLQFDGEKPDLEIYKKGVIGYLNLKKQDKILSSGLLTLIDFRLSSNKKRMWIIDLKNNKVIHHSLVAHGRNTGNEYAKTFSNIPNSNSSSLGFYVTGETYYGKHGLSLRLDGVEAEFNNNARDRAIVMHSASYVDASFTTAYGRIGRSFGCPAIPLEGHEEVINKIASKSCLFIYYPKDDYLKKSTLINKTAAFDMLATADFNW